MKQARSRVAPLKKNDQIRQIISESQIDWRLETWICGLAIKSKTYRIAKSRMEITSPRNNYFARPRATTYTFEFEL